MSDLIHHARPLPTVRVFPSSPSDVQDERAAVSRVIARLGVTYAEFVNLQVDPWEGHFYEAHQSFQQSIEAMSRYDIVVGTLWKRIGTPLSVQQFRRADGSAYESGTVFEIETALESAAAGGRPSVLVFRRTTPVLFTEKGVDAERAQKTALDAWWDRTFRDASGSFIRGYQEYDSVEDFEQALEAALVAWMLQRKTIPTGPVWNVRERGSPYPGLMAYDGRWASVYFGRSLASAQALDELLSVAHRPGRLPALFIVGPSGCGKSSLAAAGLVPRISRGVVGDERTEWRVCVVPPSNDALRALAWRLFEPQALPELAQSPQSTPQGWVDLALASTDLAVETLAWAASKAAQAGASGVKLLVVIDQVESLLGDERATIIAALLSALCARSLGWAVVTLRSDKYDALLEVPGWRELKSKGSTFDLPLPGRAEIADIVYGPARAAGLRFEESATRSVARELMAGTPGPDALPLLQMTLSALFKLRSGDELTLAALDSIHGIDGAIASYADSVLRDMEPAVSAALPLLLQGLIAEVDTDRAGQLAFTARSIAQDELLTEAQRQLASQLVDAFLLVRDHAGSLRVAHEALLRQWPPGRRSLASLLQRKRRRKLARRLAVSGGGAAVLAVALLTGGDEWVQMPVSSPTALRGSNRAIACEVRSDGTLWYAFRVQQDYALGFRNYISQVDDAWGRQRTSGTTGPSGVIAPYRLERRLFPLTLVDPKLGAFASEVNTAALQGRRSVGEAFVGEHPGGPTVLVQTVGPPPDEDRGLYNPDEHREPLPGWGALVVVRTEGVTRQAFVEGLMPTWTAKDERGDPRSPAGAISLLAVSKDVIWLGVRSAHSRAPGGLWLTRDGGAHWEQQPALGSVAGLAIAGTGPGHSILVASPAHDDLWSSIALTPVAAGVWRIDPQGGRLQPLSGLAVGDRSDVEICGVLDGKPLVRVNSSLMHQRTTANWQRTVRWLKARQMAAWPSQSDKPMDSGSAEMPREPATAVTASPERSPQTPPTSSTAAEPQSRSSSRPGRALDPAAAWPFPTGNRPFASASVAASSAPAQRPSSSPAKGLNPSPQTPPTPSTAAEPQSRSSSRPGRALDPAAAWPFPTGNRPFASASVTASSAPAQRPSSSPEKGLNPSAAWPFPNGNKP